MAHSNRRKFSKGVKLLVAIGAIPSAINTTVASFTEKVNLLTIEDKLITFNQQALYQTATNQASPDWSG